MSILKFNWHKIIDQENQSIIHNAKIKKLSTKSVESLTFYFKMHVKIKLK